MKYHALHETIQSTYPVSELGALTSAEPDYGSSARAVKRVSAELPRYIRITDFGEDGIESNHEYLAPEPVEWDSELAVDDVLFARSGSVGKTYLHEDSSERAIFAGYCIRFRFDESKASPRFVYWWTKTEAYARWVAAIQRPSVQSNINKEEFKTCPIPLPPVDIQDGLTAEMNAARAERKAKLAEADALMNGVDDFVMDALGIAPPARDARKAFAVNFAGLGGEARLDSDYYHPERMKALRALSAESGDIAVARLSEVASSEREQIKSPTENYLSLAHVQSDTGELADVSDTASGSCLVFRADDVLFARLRPYLNKVHRAERGGCCSTEFHVLRVRDRSALLPEYLAAALRSRVSLSQTVHMMTGNTHPRLTNEDVANLMIPIPSVEIQRKIAAEITRRRETARQLRAEAEAGWQSAKRRFERRLLSGEGAQ